MQQQLLYVLYDVIIQSSESRQDGEESDHIVCQAAPVAADRVEQREPAAGQRVKAEGVTGSHLPACDGQAEGITARFLTALRIFLAPQLISCKEIIGLLSASPAFHSFSTFLLCISLPLLASLYLHSSPLFKITLPI